MLRNFLSAFFIFATLIFSAATVSAQDNGTTPAPLKQGANKKRTSGVKIKPAEAVPKKAADPENSPPSPDDNTPEEAQPASRSGKTDTETHPAQPSEKEKRRLEEAERRRAEERIAAGEAALERERQKAASEAARQARDEFDRRETEMKALMEAERKKRDEEISVAKIAADEEKAANEKAVADARARAEAEEKRNAELQAQAAAAAKAAEEIEKKRIEAERLNNEKMAAEQAEKAKMRSGLIEMAARRLKFLNPSDAAALVPAAAVSADSVEAALEQAVLANPRLVQRASFCDSDFQGAPLNLDMTADDTFGTLLNELRFEFGVNFLPDAEVLSLPVRVNVKDVPWNYVLRSQLNYLDLEARCTDFNTIAVLKRSKLQTLQDNQRKTARLRTEFIKLKYLQPVVGGQVNVAGRGGAGSNALESLENSLNKIIKAEGDNRGSISRIPGKNEFIITATDDQLAQIKQVIARADRPSYQVVIYASIVTANEQKLKDVGGQFSAIGGSANLNALGGLTGFGGTTATGAASGSGSGGSTGSTSSGGGSSGSSGSGGTAPGDLNPGGVRSFGNGFSGAPQGGSTFGISSIFGTFQLAAQLSLLQQQGVVKIDNRPSIVVIDGQTADLQIGRQVSIPIQSVNNFGSGGGGQLEVLNAGNTLNASPQVIEDENGKPVAVNLNIRIESNDVDTTVVSQGVPSIIRRSTQTSLMLNTSQTAVIGGFSTDSETNSQSKTPGLGSVPGIGGLFKRKIRAKNSDRLYFAIRVEVISQGQILTTLPMNIDTTPKLPDPGNDFFKPFNQPVPDNQPKTKQP